MNLTDRRAFYSVLLMVLCSSLSSGFSVGQSDYDDDADVLTRLETRLLEKLLEKYERQSNNANANGRVKSAKLAEILRSESLHQNNEMEDFRSLPSSSRELIDNQVDGGFQTDIQTKDNQKTDPRHAKELILKLIELKKKINQAKSDNGKSFLCFQSKSSPTEQPVISY
jgi:hypothetical protein